MQRLRERMYSAHAAGALQDDPWQEYRHDPRHDLRQDLRHDPTLDQRYLRYQQDLQIREQLALLETVPMAVLGDDNAWAELASLIACGATIRVVHPLGTAQYLLYMAPCESYMPEYLTFEDWIVIFQQETTEKALVSLIQQARHVRGEVLQLRAILARRSNTVEHVRVPLLPDREFSQVFSQDHVPLEVLVYQQKELDYRLSLARWKIFRDAGGPRGLQIFQQFLQVVP